MTIKCNFCGHETIDDGRIMHGHMMNNHQKEYKEVDCDLEKVTTGYKRKPKKEYLEIRKKKKKELPLIELRPINLRLLNKSKQIELDAYNEGYRYIDPDTMIAYTLEEVKEEGWL